MKIFVRVKTGAKENVVEKIDENHFKVSVKAPPADGRANLEIVKVLAKYFQTTQSGIKIISGFKVKQKVIDIA